MATSNKIHVGIVGVSPNRGFASIAHIPALQALSEFEIRAVCTTRQESAKRLTENELSDFSGLWNDGYGQAIIEAQNVDRNHSTEV